MYTVCQFLGEKLKVCCMHTCNYRNGLCIVLSPWAPILHHCWSDFSWSKQAKLEWTRRLPLAEPSTLFSTFSYSWHPWFPTHPPLLQTFFCFQQTVSFAVSDEGLRAWSWLPGVFAYYGVSKHKIFSSINFLPSNLRHQFCNGQPSY
jgi:hypothetical protein